MRSKASCCAIGRSSDEATNAFFSLAVRAIRAARLDVVLELVVRCAVEWLVVCAGECFEVVAVLFAPPDFSVDEVLLSLLREVVAAGAAAGREAGSVCGETPEAVAGASCAATGPTAIKNERARAATPRTTSKPE